MTLAPGDPRHGTYQGYNRGCRDDNCTCRQAHARRRNEWRLHYEATGEGFMVDPLGAVRRVGALACLGYSTRRVSLAMGRSENLLYDVLMSTRIRRSTHDLIATVYDDLCMTVPDDSGWTRRIAREAFAAGHWPPLAWNDIDDPDEDPAFTALEAAGEQVTFDWVVVQRVLAGDKMPTSPEERVELWMARDWTDHEFERLTGASAQRLRTLYGPAGPR